MMQPYEAVWLVVVLNLAYFGIEFVVAPAIGSVSLFADSIDFLENTSINFLILVERLAAKLLEIAEKYKDLQTAAAAQPGDERPTCSRPLKMGSS
jgi:Co/Zn/Cd efflux system component